MPEEEHTSVVPEAVKQKAGPLPVWAWVVAAAAAIGLVLYIRGHQSGTSTQVMSAQPPADSGSQSDPMSESDLLAALQALTAQVAAENLLLQKLQNTSPSGGDSHGPPTRGTDPSTSPGAGGGAGSRFTSPIHDLTALTTTHTSGGGTSLARLSTGPGFVALPRSSSAAVAAGNSAGRNRPPVLQGGN